MSDLISRQDAIAIVRNRVKRHTIPCVLAVTDIQQLPSEEPEQRWIPVTKEEVFKAGYEGREIRFRVDGRLFAIRELTQ